MTLSERPAPRGRPPTITRERISDVGIAMGLPNITFVGVATALGVSHMALYKHVPSLDGLKQLVAEEIFNRWQIPVPDEEASVDLKEYLLDFSVAVRTFVKAHPGVTSYVIRRLAATPSMIAKIARHQRHIAEVYGISTEQARWLLATVAFHCLAAADTVYSVAGREPEVSADRAAEESEMEIELDQGFQALVVGALAMMNEGARIPGSTRFLDTTELPVARLRDFPLSASQTEQWLADMDSLIQAKQDFVLLYERLPSEGEEGDAGSRKTTVLWLKAHRKAFQTYCRGMILMCHDANQLPSMTEGLKPLEKIYRVPVVLACTHDEAQAHVERLTAS